LERSQIYYGDPAKLEQVVFHFLAGAPMALYETGQIDVTPVSTSYIDEVSDVTNPLHQELTVTPEISLYYIGFNTAKPPLTMLTSAVPFVTPWIRSISLR